MEKEPEAIDAQVIQAEIRANFLARNPEYAGRSPEVVTAELFEAVGN